MNRAEIENWFSSLQTSICKQLEEADTQGKFMKDAWQRPGGGGGLSRVLTNGKIIEKGGVNFSAVWGKAPLPVLQQLKIDATADAEFFATGISIVIHPHNPMVPIIHMNTRYFELTPANRWWFGGGIDLTPHYVDREDARYFHQQLKHVCDRHHPTYYPEFKKWADDYFFVKHRNETRGVGGIFFDYLDAREGHTQESRFEFVKDVGKAFAPIYTHLMTKNHPKSFTTENKTWQHLRRGRYVEFNLVWDRGTKFGLETDGRTESILMSLPPQAHWAYNHQPPENTPEHDTLQLLKKNIDWLHD